MNLSRQQQEILNYLIDYPLFEKASLVCKRLITESSSGRSSRDKNRGNSPLSNTQLEKMRQMTQVYFEDNPETSLAARLGNYLSHQEGKSTKEDSEKIVFAGLLRMIKEEEVPGVIQRSLKKDLEAWDKFPSDPEVMNYLFKEFIYHLIIEFKKQGA